MKTPYFFTRLLGLALCSILTFFLPNQNYASHFVAETANELRFVYNDEIFNDNIMNEYVVQEDGSINRNTLHNLVAQNLKIQYYGGIQVADNEVIIPVLQKNKLKLIQMLF